VRATAPQILATRATRYEGLVVPVISAVGMSRSSATDIDVECGCGEMAAPAFEGALHGRCCGDGGLAAHSADQHEVRIWAAPPHHGAGDRGDPAWRNARAAEGSLEGCGRRASAIVGGAMRVALCAGEGAVNRDFPVDMRVDPAGAGIPGFSNGADARALAHGTAVDGRYRVHVCVEDGSPHRAPTGEPGGYLAADLNPVAIASGIDAGLDIAAITDREQRRADRSEKVDAGVSARAVAATGAEVATAKGVVAHAMIHRHDIRPLSAGVLGPCKARGDSVRLAGQAAGQGLAEVDVVDGKGSVDVGAIRAVAGICVEAGSGCTAIGLQGSGAAGDRDTSSPADGEFSVQGSGTRVAAIAAIGDHCLAKVDHRLRKRSCRFRGTQT
jgi:hypothetical protein